MYDTEVSCTCDSLWFMTYATENYISLYGDVICNNAEYIGNFPVKHWNLNMRSNLETFSLIRHSSKNGRNRTPDRHTFIVE